MNKAQAEKLATALESGKYRQGRFRLYEYATDSFCCLGVACDLFFSLPLEPHASTLPPSAQQASGINSYDGEFLTGAYVVCDDKKRRRFRSLAKMNDSGVVSFKRIARYIRQRYKNIK